jgi:hypothetical protein
MRGGKIEKVSKLYRIALISFDQRFPDLRILLPTIWFLFNYLCLLCELCLNVV